MKKSRILIIFFMFVIVVFFLSGCSTNLMVKNEPEKESISDTTPSSIEADVTGSVMDNSLNSQSLIEGHSFPEKANEDNNQEKTDMGTVLFIGDSRTVGLMEYSGLEADFYASEGMSVYNLNKKPISVPKVGKIQLDELLSQKSYDKIYLMLGINESGYDFNKTVKKYEEVVAFIREKQSAALIFIQANLHVTKSRSEKDAVYNNSYIDRFNEEISKLADGETVFYLDVNSLFDDTEGNLSAEKSEDEVHVFAKYYAEWGNWIIKETASKIKGV